jgi:hypothetical protein
LHFIFEELQWPEPRDRIFISDPGSDKKEEWNRNLSSCLIVAFRCFRSRYNSLLNKFNQKFAMKVKNISFLKRYRIE